MSKTYPYIVTIKVRGAQTLIEQAVAHFEEEWGKSNVEPAFIGANQDEANGLKVRVRHEHAQFLPGRIQEGLSRMGLRAKIVR